MKNSSLRCKHYLGVICIDGGCPVSLQDEYAERAYDCVHSCDECYNKGDCDDCYFSGLDCCLIEEEFYEEFHRAKTEH